MTFLVYELPKELLQQQRKLRRKWPFIQRHCCLLASLPLAFGSQSLSKLELCLNISGRCGINSLDESVREGEVVHDQQEQAYTQSFNCEGGKLSKLELAVPLEAVSPPEPPPETLSPPEPPDPPDAPFTLVFLLLLDTSCAFSQPVSKAPDLESCLLNMAFVFCDEVASLVYVGDTSFVFKYWYPADCSVVLCWCDLIHSTRPLSMIVIVSIESTMGWSISITIFVSLPRPFIQVLSERFSKLMLDDELISLVWYFGLSRGPFTAVCSFFTAVCSSIFVILKSFQLWQLNGLMHHISIHCLASSVMEFVPLPISLSTLCGFVAGSVMLKIRDTSNTEVLIKGFIAMLKIVDCALVAASILEIISLIVVSNFQGVVSLYSLMVVENRGLLDFISCLSSENQSFIFLPPLDLSPETTRYVGGGWSMVDGSDETTQIVFGECLARSAWDTDEIAME
ncbi:hypothetical protein IGI04_026797 [Brassica rapa subsp. trilocularis]|uniref:Uncharacterized protein n=1 Tax=Brassica rapa subsp. trilocularis TaxID=1813537 RepID=A0ABQ7KZT5_BRACM|nr:hypothetical protein IGI04_026797 [Brassica rapa subsp. trilocularis]